ncbi:MAG: hypothetical protein U9Q81_06750 [Pseudomonadota bacterium]|nr:hypothetical protein [Pseudomonadota bacterium]
MDNDMFRRTYRSINERFCPYEKSILTNNCDCSRAKRFCIAEREGVHCNSDAAQTQCLQLLEIMRQQSRFALKATDEGTSLSHAKAMRIQVGGLRGLHAALSPEEPVPTKIKDISAIIEAARERFEDLEKLPFQTIIQQIAAYKGRKRFRSLR